MNCSHFSHIWTSYQNKVFYTIFSLLRLKVIVIFGVEANTIPGDWKPLNWKSMLSLSIIFKDIISLSQQMYDIQMNVWECLRTSENITEHLRTSQNISEHLTFYNTNAFLLPQWHIFIFRLHQLFLRYPITGSQSKWAQGISSKIVPTLINAFQRTTSVQYRYQN